MMSDHNSIVSHVLLNHSRARARAEARFFPLATVFAILTLAGNGSAGCAKASVINGVSTNGGAIGGSVGPGPSGGGGTTQLTFDPNSTVIRPDEDANVTVGGCDGGDGCVCSTLSVAVVGTRGVYGDGSDTAFKDWLNSNSAGTAKVSVYTDKPTFTADFLAGYNLIILAGLAKDSSRDPWWTFSASEVAAFQDWVENKGGGVISLSGYSGDSKEADAKNALLAFSGISYNQECISPPCAIARCPYQCGNPYQITDWNRDDPVIANLSYGIKMIGIDGARTISAPADASAHVAATTTKDSKVSNWLVGKITGKGRVLVYADEWITYTDQWNSTQYANDPSCASSTPQKLYQTAQFWYNMIHWTQPAANCFTITTIQVW